MLIHGKKDLYMGFMECPRCRASLKTTDFTATELTEIHDRIAVITVVLSCWRCSWTYTFQIESIYDLIGQADLLDDFTEIPGYNSPIEVEEPEIEDQHNKYQNWLKH